MPDLSSPYVMWDNDSKLLTTTMILKGTALNERSQSKRLNAGLVIQLSWKSAYQASTKPPVLPPALLRVE